MTHAASDQVSDAPEETRWANHKERLDAIERHHRAQSWKQDPRWEGITRPYSPADVDRLRGPCQIEHTLARLGAERLWQLLHERPFVPTLGALTGNQADAAGQGRPRRRSILAAGRSPPTPTMPARCIPTRLSIRVARAGGRAPHQQDVPARRPDRPLEGTRRHLLVRADRRRRRGRLRRPAQRLRADEGDDRGWRRGRPFRGSARLGEEVRPPRRQGAGADAGSHSQPRSRRGWPPTCLGVPTILVARTDAIGER